MHINRGLGRDFAHLAFDRPPPSIQPALSTSGGPDSALLASSLTRAGDLVNHLVTALPLRAETGTTKRDAEPDGHRFLLT
jgi:hypothetical protein